MGEELSLKKEDIELLDAIIDNIQIPARKTEQMLNIIAFLKQEKMKHGN